jgi:nucleotidyltransferase/DNA polymerase involved in DNA repair
MPRKERRWEAGCLPDAVGCIWLRGFAIQAERARRPDLPRDPLALVGPGENTSTPVIRACSPEAEAAGLCLGMAANTIPQRCSSALTLPFDPGYYQQRHRELLWLLDALTPDVESQPLEAFYLGLSGLPHVDPAAPERLLESVRRLFPPCFTPRLGIAGDKFTAWVAANAATPYRPIAVRDEERELFLREAPSTLLPVSPELARQLDLLGLRTLGRVARVRRSALLARFGREGERAHRFACGEVREALVPYRPVPVLREALGFPATAPTVEHFYLALYRLLQRVWARPERGGRGVRQVRLEAMLEHGEVWDRSFTLRRPAENWEEVFRELKRRLDGLLPTGALTELAVELAAFAPRFDCQPVLLPDETQHRQERLRDELDQLRHRQRLRHRTPVLRLVEVDPWTLLPEEQYGLISYDP